MYIIIGLGNPTDKYKGTRHNIGFGVIDELAASNGIRIDVCKQKAMCGKGIISGVKVVLAKPITYMNLSGESVRALVDFYKSDIENEVIIIYDDVDLDVGQLRLRMKGSAGGHNGIKSIITHLGTQNFNRVRVGVGKKPEKMDLANHVLGRFDAIDEVKANEGVKEAAKAVEAIIAEGMDKAMNLYNATKK